MIETNYHHVILPLEDTYSLGGRYVFNGLERKKEGKNLVLVTSEMCEKITKNKFSEGGKDAIRFLDKIKDQRIFNKNGLMLYDVNDSLHVCYIHDNSEFNKQSLEEFVRGNFKSKKGLKVISKDAKEKLKYESRKIKTEDPRFLITDSKIVDKGVLMGSEELLAKLYENNGVLDLDFANEIFPQENQEGGLFHNQFIKFITSKGYEYAKVTGKVVRNKNKTRIVRIEDQILKMLPSKIHKKEYKIGKTKRKDFFGIEAWDIEQFLAVQSGILNHDVELSFICGSQGSGKTLLPYTAAVDLILHYPKEIAKQRGVPNGKNSFFKQIVLLKPNNIMGGQERYTGFQPGNLWEKEKPHLEPFIDAHKESNLDEINFAEMILHPKRTNDYGPKRDEKLKEKKLNGCAYLPSKNEAIQIASSGYLRGRTFNNSLIIIDEGENYTPYEMRSIIGRIGPGSKGIILGDPDQLDNEKCSKDLNGLTSAIKHFLPKPQTSLIRLYQNHRSQSSEDTLDWKIFSNS